MDLKTRIALKLKTIRKSRNITQDELAGLIGRSVDAISNIERAKGLPNLETLDLLAKKLNVPISEFFETAAGRIKTTSARLQLLTRLSELGRSLTDKELAIAIKQLEAWKDEGK